MKILVVQLLRMGDVIASCPVVTALKNKYPDAQIDWLVNEETKAVKNVIPKHGKVHFFPRNALQRGLGEADRPFFFSYDLLKNFISKVNKEEYDTVINLTQNRLSAALCLSINARVKKGMHVKEGQKVSFGSVWFEFLNNKRQFDKNPVHYIDLFMSGAHVNNHFTGFGLSESKQGQLDAKLILEGEASAPIVLQPLTSDRKKNWGLKYFTTLIKDLKSFYPEKPIVVLGAPNERQELEEWLHVSQIQSKKVKLAICTIDAAYSLLLKADILITGDTSIKHLAAAANVKCLEIAIGSSRPSELGVYSENSIIVEGKEYCAPCSHSSHCHREKHFCAQRVAPESIALLATYMLSGDKSSIRRLAKKKRSHMKISETFFDASGFWQVDELINAEERRTEDARLRLEWKLNLDFRDRQRSSEENVDVFTNNVGGQI